MKYWPEGYLQQEKIYCKYWLEDFYSREEGFGKEMSRLRVLYRRRKFNKLWNFCMEDTFDAENMSIRKD